MEKPSRCSVKVVKLKLAFVQFSGLSRAARVHRALCLYVSKADYPLWERVPSWILGRDSSRLFSTSTGLIMAPRVRVPEKCCLALLPSHRDRPTALLPRSLALSFLSFDRDRPRTGSGRSSYLFYRPAGHFEFVFVSRNVRAERRTRRCRL